MISVAQRSKKQHFWLLIILGALNTITPFSIDMYLPAFPQIASDFNTTIDKVALSVSTYFLGYAIGQLIYGPLLDRYGRKAPLYVGLLIYIIATIGCFTTESIQTLLMMRFVQALGGCVASVAAMAMVRDFFPIEKSASIISLLVLILGASPLLAPTVGSYIIAWWGWHFVFVILAIITAIILQAVVFYLPKGQAPDLTVSLKPFAIARGYAQVVKEPRFYLYALAGSFSFAGLFLYVAHSPAIFMNYFGLSGKVYGAVFAILSIGFIGSSQLNHALTKRYSSATILGSAIRVQCIAAILFAIGAWQNWYGMVFVIIFLFIILACAGIVYPNAAALCMAPFEKNAGAAAALLGFIQIGIGGLISASAGLLPLNPVLTMAIIIMATVVLAIIILWWGKGILVNPSISIAE